VKRAMNKNSLGSISSSDLIDAKLEEHQMCGSKQCPGCGHKLEGKPVRKISIILGFKHKEYIYFFLTYEESQKRKKYACCFFLRLIKPNQNLIKGSLFFFFLSLFLL
jgi:hypothetical protein